MYFDDQQNVQWFVIPRYYGLTKFETSIKKFTTSPSGIMHFANAFEKDKKIHVYACRSPKVDFRDLCETEFSQLYHFILDLENGECKETKVSDLDVDFPTIDNNLLGNESCNDIFLSGMHRDHLEKSWSSIKYDSLVKISLDTRKAVKLDFGKNVYCGEWIFHKANYSYIIGFIHHDSCQQTDIDEVWNDEDSYLMIFDATDLKLLCKIKIPKRVPYGFHGTFLPSKFSKTTL